MIINNTYMRLKKYALAKQHYKIAIELNPKSNWNRLDGLFEQLNQANRLKK